VRIRRPAPQTLGAAGVLALLAVVVALTSHDNASAFASYASTDYGAGGYRAWAALLGREGVATGRFVLRPIELDAGIDTLVSAQPVPELTDPGARTPADLAALSAWVRRGGRLVYLGRNSALTAAEQSALALPFWLPEVGARGGFTGPAAGAVRELHALGTSRMLLVEHPGRPLLFDGNGDIVVRYPLGRGEVVAVSDTLPFTNVNIAHADNARLAYLLARPRRPDGVVAFDDGLHGALIDRPWYRALPIPVRVSLSIAGVALVLGLAGSALRGGPPMPLEPPREPSSAEFVDALAALHERIGARAAVRDVLVHDALAAAAPAIGLPTNSPPGEIAQRVGNGSAGDGLRRLLAVLEAPVDTDAQLLSRAKLVYSLRKDISNGGNGDGRRAAFAGRTRTHRRW
jgi:Domain of unknown function (DUF4350)